MQTQYLQANCFDDLVTCMYTAIDFIYLWLYLRKVQACCPGHIVDICDVYLGQCGVVSERERCVMALHLPTRPLETCSGLELGPKTQM